MLLRTLTCAVVCLALCSADALAQYSRHVSPGFGGSRSYGGFGGGSFGGGSFGGSPFGGATAGTPRLGDPGNLSLVIAQSQEGHDDVADLLGQLRRLQDQQVRNEVRFHTLNDSFFERIGVNFGFNIKGGGNIVGLDPTGAPTASGDIEFRQGGATSATPPFGGFDPGSQGTAGFAVLGDEADLFFNFFAGQGNSRSLVTQAPSVTIPNGGQGFVSDTSQTPFVTGVIPVVGSGIHHHLPTHAFRPAPAISPLQERMQRLRYEQIRERTTPQQARVRQQATTQTVGGGGTASSENSSANHGDLSIAAIRRQQAAEDTEEDRELQTILERARGAEAAGKFNVAKIYYKQALRRASGTAKDQIIAKLRELAQQQ